MDNENITKEVMEQYEQLRQMGPTNMLDLSGVQFYAGMLDLEDLADFAQSRENYMDLLMNFSGYMEKYEIRQPKPAAA